MATTTNSWIGGNTGNNAWDVASNWSLGTVPTSTSRVTIGKTGSYSVTISATDPSYTMRTLTVSGTGVHKLVDAGTLNVIGATALTGNDLDVSASGVANLAGVSFDGSSTIFVEGALNASGTLTGTGGAVDVDGGSLFADTLAGNSTYSLSLGGSLEVNTAASSTSVIAFADSQADSLILDQTTSTFAARITGFNGADSIDLTSVPFLSSYTTSYSGTTITIDNGTTPVFTLANINTPGAITLSDDGSGGTMIACFLRGTRILTARGEVAVEALSAGDEATTSHASRGDMALTLVDGELTARPVKWIGSRRINLATQPRPETVAPVRIRRDAFADNVPHDDLLLSPDHAVFIDGKLICVRQLVNGTTIRQEPGWAAVEYFHVELDTHAVLLAEGLPVESYLDTGNRGFFADACEPLVLHPDLTDEASYREAASCHPVVWDEAGVLPVWQLLSQRAAVLGMPVPALETTMDPDLCIVAMGRVLRPIRTENGRIACVVPKGTTEVHVISRAGSPTDTRPWLEDRRRLGVYVERIVLRGWDEMLEIPVDHPSLSQGWWETEHDGTALRRWTNGDAVLPLPPFDGPTTLEIRAGSSGMAYVVSNEQRQAA